MDLQGKLVGYPRKPAKPKFAQGRIALIHQSLSNCSRTTTYGAKTTFVFSAAPRLTVARQAHLLPSIAMIPKIAFRASLRAKRNFNRLSKATRWPVYKDKAAAVALDNFVRDRKPEPRSTR